MKNVGFFGGFSIFELGLATDMLCFFSLIREKVDFSSSEQILFDRLFKKYLLIEQLEDVLILIDKIKISMSEIDVDVPTLEKVGWIREGSRLTFSNKKFLNIFAKYFLALDHCILSSRAFYEAWGAYKPVMVIITAMPDFILEKARAKEDYDSLNCCDSPFWLR